MSTLHKQQMKILVRTFLILNSMISATFYAQSDSTLFKQSDFNLVTQSGTLYGTLTMPSSEKTAVPVVLIIAGSGPTDRDCNNPMMKNDAYKKLAMALAANHIASVRYDKRGIAASRDAGKSEKDLRFTDYVKDAADWITLLKSDKRFSEVIVLGHSEGSLIGMLAAKKNAAKFISVAGIAQSADKILKEQLVNLPDNLKKRSFLIIDQLAEGKEVANTPAELGSLFRSSVQPYLISWFKEKPEKAMAALRMPVLVVQGTADLQVKAEEGRRLAAARKGNQLLMIEGMNHVLRVITGGQSENMDSYDDPNLPLARELVSGICAFILTQ